MISSSEVQRKLLARNASRTVNRHDFSEDFVFGTATSAYQHEGATAEDGRGPSIWDTFTLKTRGRVKDNSNANVSVDTYHRYKEDVKLMKKIGLNAYRFSISWSRVLPGGSLDAGVNKQGIKYYNNLIDTLLAHGIEPYVTLFHWDLPQALEYEYGGFVSPQIIKDFCAFASLCFWEFGDRVKHWITLNDPWTFCFGGYVMGTMAPWRGSSSAGHVKGSIAFQRHTHGCACICHNGNPGTEPYLVAHNMLLAHAAAVDLYKEKFQQLQEGKIGITLFSKWFEPLYDNELDEEAATRAFDFMLGWFLEPLTSGEYPESMIKLVGSRLPLFSTEDSKLVKGSYDFLGLKYYTATYVKSESNSHGLEVSYTTDPQVTYTTDALFEFLVGKEVPIGPKAASDWLYIYPQGIFKLLVYIKDVYNVPLIYIAENGVDEMNNTSLTVSESRVDDIRIKYHQDHLLYIRYAIMAGVNVKGYFIWSLFDGFEWSQGYTVRFGIFHVNFKDDLARFPKNSALWLMNFLNRKLAKGRMKRQIEGREEHNPAKRLRTR
ncbi:raucaffricine-O-beta-D-glucosidase-like [Olea europaea var. sylvestris]|uniref:raucaffricine-O-beta-D-glucosidase-like n=1 Tax=Olea europaea var. sylvestris TaxID=158386 RepID=UPI000C1D4023|nr:raucaffricine-O-beta-D-glucosidase-like [Olea europaea var. sylvestris]